MCFRGCEKEKAMLRCMVRKKVEKEERRGVSFGEAKRRRDCCIDKVSVRRKEN
jgi:hypothetical protein